MIDIALKHDVRIIKPPIRDLVATLVAIFDLTDLQSSALAEHGRLLPCLEIHQTCELPEHAEGGLSEVRSLRKFGTDRKYVLGQEPRVYPHSAKALPSAKVSYTSLVQMRCPIADRRVRTGENQLAAVWMSTIA